MLLPDRLTRSSTSKNGADAALRLLALTAQGIELFANAKVDAKGMELGLPVQLQVECR